MKLLDPVNKVFYPQASFCEQVMPISEILVAMENAGDVNTVIAEHKTSKNDVGDIQIQALEKVVFVLDPPREKKKKSSMVDIHVTHWRAHVNIWVVSSHS